MDLKAGNQYQYNKTNVITLVSEYVDSRNNVVVRTFSGELVIVSVKSLSEIKKEQTPLFVAISACGESEKAYITVDRSTAIMLGVIIGKITGIDHARMGHLYDAIRAWSGIKNEDFIKAAGQACVQNTRIWAIPDICNV